jgi:DNA-dependent metalloprotease WSS1
MPPPYILPGQDPHSILEITTLGLPHHDPEAKQVLDELSKRVQPILRQRQWTVGKLAEVIPPGMPGGPPARLFRGAAGKAYYGLNIGGGDNKSCLEIRLYLRRRGPDGPPIDADAAMGVMLHELAHIKRGPHDRIFYETLDQLWKEYKEFEAKGIRGTGKGFDAQPAGRLADFGGTHMHNPPKERLPSLAAEAAERRARQQQLMGGGGGGGGGGGRKLGSGGGGSGGGGGGRTAQERGLTPTQAAAEAAERRAEDNKWCPVEVIVIEEEEEEGPGGAGGGGGGVKAERVAATAGGGGARGGGGGAAAAAGGGGGGDSGRKKRPKRDEAAVVVDLTGLDDD